MKVTHGAGSPGTTLKYAVENGPSGGPAEGGWVCRANQNCVWISALHLPGSELAPGWMKRLCRQPSWGAGSRGSFWPTLRQLGRCGLAGQS